jgi:hypothetical protein
MEVGDPGVPIPPAVLHVVREPRPELDPVTIHHLNMVVKPAQDQPYQVLPVMRYIVQLMENGDPGVPMAPAVVHVAREEPRPDLDPVTILHQNIMVKPVQDQLHQVLAVSHIVLNLEFGDPGVPMAPAVLHVVEEPRPDIDPVTIHHQHMVVQPAQDQLHQVLAVTQFHADCQELYGKTI